MSDGFDRLREAEIDGDVPESMDEAALERLRAVAYLLDESVRVPGTEVRVGIDPLVSSIPVVGDVVSGGLSLYIVVEAAYLGVSYATVVRMLANIAVDVVGGSLPYVGTVLDAVWKTNKRNVELLLKELEREGGSGRERKETAESSEVTGVTIEVTGSE